jgi:hypothetical protein
MSGLRIGVESARPLPGSGPGWERRRPVYRPAAASESARQKKPSKDVKDCKDDKDKESSDYPSSVFIVLVVLAVLDVLASGFPRRRLLIGLIEGVQTQRIDGVRQEVCQAATRRLLGR